MTSVVAPGLKVASTLNRREHWAVRHKRARREKDAVLVALWHAKKPPAGSRLRVTFTRLYSGRAKSMDTDNLAAGFKACRDAVAQWLWRGDDEGAGVDWQYRQEKSDATAVRITVEELQ